MSNQLPLHATQSCLSAGTKASASRALASSSAPAVLGQPGREGSSVALAPPLPPGGRSSPVALAPPKFLRPSSAEKSQGASQPAGSRIGRRPGAPVGWFEAPWAATATGLPHGGPAGPCRPCARPAPPRALHPHTHTGRTSWSRASRKSSPPRDRALAEPPLTAPASGELLAGAPEARATATGRATRMYTYDAYRA